MSSKTISIHQNRTQAQQTQQNATEPQQTHKQLVVNVRPGFVPRGQSEALALVQSGLEKIEVPGLMLKSKIEIPSTYAAGYIVCTVLPAGLVAPNNTSPIPSVWTEGWPT